MKKAIVQFLYSNRNDLQSIKKTNLTLSNRIKIEANVVRIEIIIRILEAFDF